MNKDYKKQVRRFTLLNLVCGEYITIFVVDILIFLFSLVAIFESIEDITHFPNLETVIGILGIIISIIIFKRWKRRVDNNKHIKSGPDKMDNNIQ